MDRAEIIEGQSRAVEALIELIRRGRPPLSWALSEKPDLYGMLPGGLGDAERYALLARWADILGTELRSSSHTLDTWEGGSSDPEHTGGHAVTHTWESLDVAAVKDGVPVRLSESVPLGTSARAHGRLRPGALPGEPARAAQLKAATALAEVLRADLPTAGWGMYVHSEEPALSGTIRIQRAKASRADLTEWAGFLGTEVDYRREKRAFGTHRWGEVTGHVLGVRVLVKTDVRAPSAIAGHWRARTGRGPAARARTADL
ncbi:hypothetical protein R6V09_50655 [Streptomyces sp. W16]|uniref:hypothetical protein n=1 Tax=Streptomyces sp. W16 TaxID=3076631 RepID=UPI00295B2EF4|nr:hypothetical protein [Streptomyces sp. W16]MDV9178368.1 hypothetical protein [Streptomyces sp. W16]